MALIPQKYRNAFRFAPVSPLWIRWAHVIPDASAVLSHALVHVAPLTDHSVSHTCRPLELIAVVGAPEYPWLVNSPTSGLRPTPR